MLPQGEGGPTASRPCQKPNYRPSSLITSPCLGQDRPLSGPQGGKREYRDEPSWLILSHLDGDLQGRRGGTGSCLLGDLQPFSLCLTVRLFLYLYTLTCLSEINAKMQFLKLFFLQCWRWKQGPWACWAWALHSATCCLFSFEQGLTALPRLALAQAGLELSMLQLRQAFGADEKAALQSQAWQDLSLNLADFAIY